MSVSEIIKSLQDPAGIPFYPFVFQSLMVFTFAIHILFVNLTIGSSFFSVYGKFRGGEFWGNLSKTMPKVTTVSISMAILYGIAPLLFVQTLYDPFWYTSNNFSQWWVIGFIFILMLAYGLTYVVYRKDNNSLKFTSLIVFILLVLCGVIMHSINYQMLRPEKWYEWYVKGNSINPYGLSLKSISIPRFLHFVVPSFAVAGVFLMLYGWYFKDRRDYDKKNLDIIAKIGAQIAFYVTLIQIVIGIWWLISLKSEFKLYIEPLFIIAVFSALLLLHNLYMARKAPFRFAPYSVLLLLLTVFFMSLLRELLRMKYLKEFNYSIYEYKLNIDLVSTSIFSITFLLGAVIIGYLLYIAYSAGRSEERFSSTTVIKRWGLLSIILLILWISVFILIGFISNIH